jgi:SMI1 / KNR4 family (SUKH-1)
MSGAPTPGDDELIARLRTRAADPDRRVDVRQNPFMTGVSTLDLGGLMGMLGSVSGDLQRVVAANQAGQPIDAALQARAEQFGQAMNTPVETPLPAPADPAAIARAEAALGFSLPPFLARIYGGIANGGFGPGGGLLGLDEAVAAYARVRTGAELPRGRSWPDGLLPVVARDPGFYCVDTTTEAGRVVDWDPEELGEFSGEAAFARSLTEESSSVAAWLGAWVGGRTQAEEHAELMQQAMANAMTQSRAAYAAMTPEQKAQWGLTDDEWKDLLGGEGDESQERPPGG